MTDPQDPRTSAGVFRIEPELVETEPAATDDPVEPKPTATSEPVMPGPTDSGLAETGPDVLLALEFAEPVPVVHPLVRDPQTPRTPQRLFAIVLAVGMAAVAIILPFTATPTFVTHMTLVAAYTLAFAGLSLLTQRLGLFSLGQGALIGVGAVAAQHSVNDLGVPLMLMPVVGFLAGLVVGALLGIPSLRLPKSYLALLTFSAAVVFPIVVRQIDGPLPVTLDGAFLPPSWIGIEQRDEHIWEYIIVATWVIVILFLLHRLLHGPIGRALEASNKSDAASTFGIAVYRLRLGAVALSGGLAGTAGALQLVAINFTDQNQFKEGLSIKMFALVIAFAGVASARSSLLRSLAYITSATVLVFLPVWLNDRPGWALQGGWGGLIRSEGFYYAALLLVTAVWIGRFTRRKGSQLANQLDELATS